MWCIKHIDGLASSVEGVAFVSVDGSVPSELMSNNYYFPLMAAVERLPRTKNLRMRCIGDLPPPICPPVGKSFSSKRLFYVLHFLQPKFHGRLMRVLAVPLTYYFVCFLDCFSSFHQSNQFPYVIFWPFNGITFLYRFKWSS